MLPPPSLWGCAVRGRGQSDGLGCAAAHFNVNLPLPDVSCCGEGRSLFDSQQPLLAMLLVYICMS